MVKTELQIQQWHWDRYVSTIRRLWKGLPIEHLPFELVLEAQKTARRLAEADLDPFKHLKLTGEKIKGTF